MIEKGIIPDFEVKTFSEIEDVVLEMQKNYEFDKDVQIKDKYFVSSSSDEEEGL